MASEDMTEESAPESGPVEQDLYEALMRALLPCAHCGEEWEGLELDDDSEDPDGPRGCDERVVVRCESCFAEGPPTWIGCRDNDALEVGSTWPEQLYREAVEVWNGRSPPASGAPRVSAADQRDQEPVGEPSSAHPLDAALVDAACEAEWARLEAMTDEQIAEAEGPEALKANADRVKALLLDVARRAKRAREKLSTDPTLYRTPIGGTKPPARNRNPIGERDGKGGANAVREQLERLSSQERQVAIESFLDDVKSIAWKRWAEVDDAWLATKADLASLGSALFQPETLWDGDTTLTERCLGAIEALYQRVTDTKTSEHDEAMACIARDAASAALTSARERIAELEAELGGTRANGQAYSWKNEIQRLATGISESFQDEEPALDAAVDEAFARFDRSNEDASSEEANDLRTDLAAANHALRGLQDAALKLQGPLETTIENRSMLIELAFSTLRQRPAPDPLSLVLQEVEREARGVHGHDAHLLLEERDLMERALAGRWLHGDMARLVALLVAGRVASERRSG